jgi:hypothetical protein
MHFGRSPVVAIVNANLSFTIQTAHQCFLQPDQDAWLSVAECGTDLQPPARTSFTRKDDKVGQADAADPRPPAPLVLSPPKSPANPTLDHLCRV